MRKTTIVLAALAMMAGGCGGTGPLRKRKSR